MLFLKVIKNSYQDSIFLMSAARGLLEREGVNDAVAVMGTELNKTVLREFGVGESAVEAIKANDLAIAVEADSEDAFSEAVKKLDGMGSEAPSAGGGAESAGYSAMEEAREGFEGANLAFISVPGEFAAGEAMEALQRGLDAFIFSDNVPIEDEVRLKAFAQEQGRWVFGPGCGAGVANGISLGMMSKVARGGIGIVGASGSGIHEIAMLIDHAGEGISQAIGTGGRDLAREVAGATFIRGLRYLLGDGATKVVVLVAKPPHPEVASKVYAELDGAKKPAVVFFPGADRAGIQAAGALCAESLEHAAALAVALMRGQKPVLRGYVDGCARELSALSEELLCRLGPGQKYLRGLFCGGTHCEEAILLLAPRLKAGLRANVNFGGAAALPDSGRSAGNTVVDLGGEEFTRGKPHPVIDPSILCKRLYEECLDPETAVVYFDLLLGYGAHPDPVGAIEACIQKANRELGLQNRRVCVICALCGTKSDPQGYEGQKRRLEELGVVVMKSNSRAAILCSLILSGVK